MDDSQIHPVISQLAVEVTYIHHAAGFPAKATGPCTQPCVPPPVLSITNRMLVLRPNLQLPWSLFYNVSRNLRAQIGKCGNLLLHIPSCKHASRDEIFQPLTTRRDGQMGTKSRGLFSMWANPFRHLHRLAIKQPIW